MEVQAVSIASLQSAELTRLVFDDASTAAPIPEPSRLALLTLGAAGILARRRRKARAA